MITIYASTSKEYDIMMEFAQNYICRQTPYSKCGQYSPGDCDTCYKDNHVKSGITVCRIVDDKDEDEL